MRIAWNTVHRYLERAANSCRQFNDGRTPGLEVAELQADEIKMIIGGRDEPIWIFTSMEVWSRLWLATVVGRRSYRNAGTLFQDVSSWMNFDRVLMISTDGFEFYKKIIQRIFGSACLYGQVIKTRRNDRVVKVERRAVIGARWRWGQALRDSEDQQNWKVRSSNG
jgi:hypothetical protein